MPDVSTPLQAEINQAAQKADFQSLLLAALPSMRQQALALTRKSADADDLVQATVVNALAGRASFTPGTNLRAWLSSIMRNRFLSDIRRRRDTSSIDDVAESSLSMAPSQEDSLALGELRRHLARLPADHRLVLMMVTVQGMSYEEVSEQLGVAVGTLKCRVFRARKMLKTWLLGEEKARESPRDARKSRDDAPTPARRVRAERPNVGPC